VQGSLTSEISGRDDERDVKWWVKRKGGEIPRVFEGDNPVFC